MDNEKQIWEGVVINIQNGDVITSKKGIITKSAICERVVSSKRLKYLGKGLWESLDNPIEIENLKEVKQDNRNSSPV